MPAADLPYVDEHTTFVSAPRAQVWSALLESLARAFAPAGPYARLVGCEDTAATGPRPLATGSTVPGFRVTQAQPPQRLVLEGRHRFSSYALVLSLCDEESGCRLRAETRAEFPGAAGGVYRVAVLRSGAHVLGVRRLLSGVRRRAEQQVQVADGA